MYSNGDIYEGEFQHGKQTGMGVKHFVSSNEKYEGEWINGQMTGYGKYFFSSQDNKIYTGQFYHGDLYGNGVITTTKYIYRGMVKNGYFDGYGKLEDLNSQIIYEGNFKEGQQEGLGR